MQENYINIYTSFLADLIEQGSLQGQDIYFLMAEFEPVCESFKSRNDLENFLDKYIEKYPQLSKLKLLLADKNFIFKSK